MQDQIKSSTGTRSFSTSTRRSQVELHGQGKSFDEQTAAVMASMISQVNQQAEELHDGIKFDPVETLPKTQNFRTRYDSLLEQFTKLLMTDGKLSRAQKVRETLGGVLNYCSTVTYTIYGEDTKLYCCAGYGVHSGPPPDCFSASAQPQAASASWTPRPAASTEPRPISHLDRRLRCSSDQDSPAERYRRWWCVGADSGSSRTETTPQDSD